MLGVEIDPACDGLYARTHLPTLTSNATASRPCQRSCSTASLLTDSPLQKGALCQPLHPGSSLGFILATDYEQLVKPLSPCLPHLAVVVVLSVDDDLEC